MKKQSAQLLFTPETSAQRFLPEGPYAIDETRFSWVSIQHGSDAKIGGLNVFDFRTKTNKTFELPGRPGFAFATTRPGVFVVGCERSIGLFDTETLGWTVLCDGIDADCEGTIINDGMVYQDNLIFGTKDLEFKTKKASLYLFRMRDRKLVKLAGGQICSNGKVMRMQDDGSLQLLDIDTPTREVAAYDLDVDAGTLANRRVVLDCSKQVGFPDGMTISPNGQSIFISFYNPDFAPFGETREFLLATGEQLAAYTTVDAPQNTCPQICRLGGKVYLVITTAVEHMPAERQIQSPLSGSIFYVEMPYADATDCPKFPIA